jgi:hypothetical protein
MARTKIRADGIVEDTLEDKDGDTKVQVEESSDEDKIRFDTAGSERMIIDATGNVGIGTSAPTEILTLNTPSQGEPTISFKEADAEMGTIGINASQNIVIENKTSNKHIVFKASDAGVSREGLRLDGAVPEVVVNQTSDSLVDFRVESDNNTHMLYVDGANDKVGIGTSTPSDIFHVVGATKLQGNTFVTGSFNVTGSAQIKSDSLVNQKAIQFDGLTPFDEVTISDSTTATSFSSGGGVDKPFTISMWVNLEEIDYDGTNGKHSGGLYTKRSTSPNDGEIYIGVGSGLLQIVLYADPDENGIGTFSTSNRIAVSQSSSNNKFFHAENTWFHLCITYDGSKATTGIRVYKNSHPVGNGSIYEGGGTSSINNDLNVPGLIYFTTQTSTNYSGMPRTSIPTTLGGIDVNDSTANALAGKLADVCRFGRVLTPTEVQELYNGGKVKNMEEHSAYSDLVHWWKMGDHIDTIGQDGIKDYVGGYHGTLGGDAVIVPDSELGSDVVSTWSITSSGSLGVGTSKPGVPFHVIGSSKIEGDLDLISGNTTVKSYNRLKTKAISFDGTGDYISISDHDDFTFSDGSSDKPFSIQAWIKIEDTATDEGTIISKYNANTDAEWLFWQDNGVIRLNLYDNNESPPTVNAIKLTGDSASLTNDTWHHVVVTYDGSESHTGITAYVDGLLISATTEQSNTYNGMVNTTVPVWIGGSYSQTIDFEKRIASVAVFTKELTAAEVLELYNDGKVMNLEYHSAYSKILSWWKMGDDQDTTGTDGIKDYVGSHHGTLNGDASIVDESNLPSEFLESFRINTAGNVGIGTTTPEKKLHVYGDAKLQGDVTVSGEITAATQPAFLARKPSNNQDSFAIDTGVDVTLSTEDFDVGSNFASNTFTAPTTGVYIFTANVYLTNLDVDATSYSLDLVTDAGTYRLAIVDPGAFSADVGEYTLNGSMPLLLTAGDTAKIQVYQAGGSQQTNIRGSGTRGTFFAGYLLG